MRPTFIAFSIGFWVWLNERHVQSGIMEIETVEYIGLMLVILIHLLVLEAIVRLFGKQRKKFMLPLLGGLLTLLYCYQIHDYFFKYRVFYMNDMSMITTVRLYDDGRFICWNSQTTESFKWRGQYQFEGSVVKLWNEATAPKPQNYHLLEGASTIDCESMDFSMGHRYLELFE